ncbi:MAG: NAD-dependent epimerase/dehydratase family protein [Actinobacteria bacterium]|nr:NAD-dependent epimerase/dehydratase family protein [Actinomycetota bacterium]
MTAGSTLHAGRGGIWVSDADGALGTRVLGRLGAHAGFHTVAAEACDVAVYAGAADPDTLARRRQSITRGAAAVFDQIDHAHHLVLVSSAMVYGAWENNPVPLTEDAPVRPDNEFAYARQLATVEHMADEWRRARPGRTVTVLRPVIAMAANGTSGLARALAAGLGQRFAVDDPPSQFLHLDDLASAVVLAAEESLDGVFNVAPDGYVPAASVRALAGAAPRLQLPDRLADVVNTVRWRFQRGPIPPGLRSYTRSPWLVANDRLKARGWRPTVTNEQAYVEGTEAKWWTMITPKRRQELSLGALVVGGVGVIATIVAVIRSVRRRRARR